MKLASLHFHPCPFHNDFDLGMVILIFFAHLGSGKSLKYISQQLLVFPFVKFQGNLNMFIRSIYVKYNCHFLANLHLMEHLLCWKFCHSFRLLFPPDKTYFPPRFYFISFGLVIDAVRLAHHLDHITLHAQICNGGQPKIAP